MIEPINVIGGTSTICEWNTKMTSAPPYKVARASLDDLDDLERLFDDYRVFYQQRSDRALARAFLSERIKRAESVIFLVRDFRNKALGFIQLYPSFSSVSAMRIWILNDLFVDSSARRNGVAKLLMESARIYALHTGVARIILSTGRANIHAQELYESLGYIRGVDDGMKDYTLAL